MASSKRFQLNLLPDVKLSHIRVRRQRRLVSMVATTFSVFSILLIALLFSITNFVQKNQIDQLSQQIQNDLETLSGTEDLSKILTVQNQLGSLPALHGSKTAINRLFVFMNQLIPADITVSDIEIDFESRVIRITGNAPLLEDVNRLVDTFKFAEYTSDEFTEPVKAFGDVVLQGSQRDDNQASYVIEGLIDEYLFDTTQKNLAMNVPSITSSRSELEKPSSLFDTNVDSTVETQQSSTEEVINE